MNSGAGPLRDRLHILRPVDRAHPSGAPCDSWQPIHRIWGAFEGFTGRLYLAALAEQSGLSARARIRRRSDILPGMRVQARGDLYHIQAVQPDPDPAWQWLLLERIDGNG